MQYKKADIRQRILDVGKAEYLENGFRGGNIKTIADKAGVPVGNLYRYFDGKSGLLDAIVAPVYNEIPEIINKLANLFISQKYMSFHDIMPILTENVLKLFDNHKAELLILAYRCEKTQYEDFIDKIVSICSNLIVGYVRSDPDEDQKEFISIISRSFVTTLFELFREDYDRNKLGQLINKLMEFTFDNINDRI